METLTRVAFRASLTNKSELTHLYAFWTLSFKLYRFFFKKHIFMLKTLGATTLKNYVMPCVVCSYSSFSRMIEVMFPNPTVLALTLMTLSVLTITLPASMVA